MEIISRQSWGARPPKQEHTHMKAPAAFVFIHHGDSAEAHDRDTCQKRIRAYQNTHMDDNKWDDIGYSFVVGEDGNAYEGRGWQAVGAHTLGYNNKGIGICIIGSFKDHVPNEAAINCVKRLIQRGLELGHISPTFTLKGHRDVMVTECPGEKLYELIRSWDHFKPGK